MLISRRDGKHNFSVAIIFEGEVIYLLLYILAKNNRAVLECTYVSNIDV